MCRLPLPPGSFSTLLNAEERFVETYFTRKPVSCLEKKQPKTQTNTFSSPSSIPQVLCKGSLNLSFHLMLSLYYSLLGPQKRRDLFVFFSFFLSCYVFLFKFVQYKVSVTDSVSVELYICLFAKPSSSL